MSGGIPGDPRGPMGPHRASAITPPAPAMGHPFGTGPFGPGRASGFSTVGSATLFETLRFQTRKATVRMVPFVLIML